MTRNVAVAATGAFGADVLERLAGRHEITAVLTRPDAPAGRGRKLARSPAKEAADLEAQLPTGLKRLWRSDDRRERPVEKLHAADFLGRVRQWAGLPDDTEARRAVSAVFGVLQRALGSPTGREGEAWDVLSVLPKDMKLLWLEAAANHA